MKQEQAFGYIRTCREDRGTTGNTIAAQTKRIKVWCKKNNHHLEKIFVDKGISGRTTLNRLAFNGAMETVRIAKATLVTCDMARISRDMKDVLSTFDRFDRNSMNLVLLSEGVDGTTASGKFFLRVVSLLFKPYVCTC